MVNFPTKQESVLTKPCPASACKKGAMVVLCLHCNGTGHVAMTEIEMQDSLTERLGAIIASIDDLTSAMGVRGWHWNESDVDGMFFFRNWGRSDWIGDYNNLPSNPYAAALMVFEESSQIDESRATRCAESV